MQGGFLPFAKRRRGSRALPCAVARVQRQEQLQYGAALGDEVLYSIPLTDATELHLAA